MKKVFVSVLIPCFNVFTAGIYTQQHNSEMHTLEATIVTASKKRAEASPAHILF